MFQVTLDIGKLGFVSSFQILYRYTFFSNSHTGGELKLNLNNFRSLEPLTTDPSYKITFQIHFWNGVILLGVLNKSAPVAKHLFVSPNVQ